MDSPIDTVADTSVAGAMHTFPKTCGPATTVADARAFFENPKVHALLVVDGGVLVSVVERGDLEGHDDPEPAAPAGRLGDRVAAPGDDLHAARAAMARAGRRRVAVADDAGRLVGLLCLKSSGRGFCSDSGIQARIDERAAAER
ncbi:CBS domain-containing protein [Pseudonocardia sp. C8]|uniref:CBS domain-containing protein n=1 Tax=Pseudonocardia sp. C8 TaxID=2762759 RepID=UPI001642795E|nr:CBS domain-containing protein [Pseudonocardia sp. C8]MBC3194930.1 CBS domain-containing protein [Pseudonocardia sp. C8]